VLLNVIPIAFASAGEHLKCPLFKFEGFVVFPAVCQNNY
jgi:hypothetical protein